VGGLTESSSVFKLPDTFILVAVVIQALVEAVPVNKPVLPEPRISTLLLVDVIAAPEAASTQLILSSEYCKAVPAVVHTGVNVAFFGVVPSASKNSNVTYRSVTFPSACAVRGANTKAPAISQRAHFVNRELKIDN
jgi:hypothetical protein